MREKIAFWMKNTPEGKNLMIFIVSTAMVSIVLYVVATYDAMTGTTEEIFHYIDIGLDFFFL